MAEVTVTLRNVRMAPRKVRQVIDLVRGMDATLALDQLIFTPRFAALPIRKLLASAVAAAKERNLNPQGLRIATIRCDQGSALRRHRYRSRGRATPVKKYTSHVILTISDSLKKRPRPRAAVTSQS